MAEIGGRVSGGAGGQERVSSRMKTETLPALLAVLQIAATLLFFATLYAGYYMARNYQRLFGADPNIPSENGSARAYSKVQVFAIWVHVLVASAAFALLLH